MREVPTMRSSSLMCYSNIFQIVRNINDYVTSLVRSRGLVLVLDGIVTL